MSKLASKAIRPAASALAILAFIFCALTPHQIIGYVVGLVTVLGLGVLHHAKRRDRFVAAQVLVLAGFVVAYANHGYLLIATSAIVAALLLNQELFAGGKSVKVANLAGRGIESSRGVNPRLQADAHSALVAIIGIGAAASLTVWPLTVLTVLVAALSAAHLGRETLRRLRRRDGSASIRAALVRHQPEFAVYFNAPRHAEHQLTMWLPYLERIGRPFIVILREPHSLEAIAAATSAPVLVCNAVADVDNAVVPSLRAAFYVNNGAKNAHMVRFNQLTHIQLLHGDSDKASSYNPVTAMFDKIFVAGQAAVDRYAAHDVFIDPEKFVIVGRPQVEPIEVAAGPAPHTPATVMYGTTWAGLYADANYCSLSIGEKIVEELLRRGVTVIFRPHPYVERNPETKVLAERVEELLAADRTASGRAHVFGRAAATASLWDCFNKADALISDVSGIASDFLYSGKPLAMTDMVDEGDDFARKFPVARGAYVLRTDASNLGALLDDMLGADPLDETRRTVKQYYLGDIPADTYAEAFLDAARREITASPVSAPPNVTRSSSAAT